MKRESRVVEVRHLWLFQNGGNFEFSHYKYMMGLFGLPGAAISEAMTSVEAVRESPQVKRKVGAAEVRHIEFFYAVCLVLFVCLGWAAVGLSV